MILKGLIYDREDVKAKKTPVLTGVGIFKICSLLS